VCRPAGADAVRTTFALDDPAPSSHADAPARLGRVFAQFRKRELGRVDLFDVLCEGRHFDAAAKARNLGGVRIVVRLCEKSLALRRNVNEWSNERALGVPNRVLVERSPIEIDRGGDAIARVIGAVLRFRRLV